jgi:hypothetical protein
LFREQALAPRLLLTLRRVPERSLVEYPSRFLSYELARALLGCLGWSCLARVILLGCLRLVFTASSPSVGSRSF